MATNPKKIPFRRFNGFLKQHAHDRLQPLEQELFNFIFPEFAGDDSAENAYKDAVNNPLLKNLSPFIEIMQGDRRVRRYAGYNFPRKRYHTISKDSEGNDDQTLVHELRAYLNPLTSGMVEVIDLSCGCHLQIDDEAVKLPPELAIIVLLHDFERLPKHLQELFYKKLPPYQGHPLYMYRFPYHVRPMEFDQVLDLRYPDTRDWFFKTFQKTQEVDYGKYEIQKGEANKYYTTAYSRYHLENEHPPTPEDFWHMLPTLINPDLGGGNIAYCGSTLNYIGQCMRTHGVNAFIYPSARADVSVVFKDGNLSNYIGWNLIDFSDSPVFYGNIDLTTFDPNPWAWVRFDFGVKLYTSKSDPQYSGSFALEGVIDANAIEYSYLVETINFTREKYPDLGITNASEFPTWSAFRIGFLLLAWVRHVLNGDQQNTIDELLFELHGLSIQPNLYCITGRIGEIWNQFQKLEGRWTENPVDTSIIVADQVCGVFNMRFPGKPYRNMVRLGSDISLLQLFLFLKDTKMTAVPDCGEYLNGFKKSLLECSSLPSKFQSELEKYYENAFVYLESSSPVKVDFITFGNEVAAEITAYLKEQE
ncbi:MAG: hypothetical protein JW881_18810 [Spirochaetales bacterium]|nr:hypothetical protein [Spirochaetales bacterium]